MDICNISKGFYSQIEDTLILCFFNVFSRLEYALKESGYAKGGPSAIYVNWEDFIEDNKDNYSNENAHNVNNEIFRNLQKQVYIDDQIDWGCFEINSDDSLLKTHIDIIKTIRNNFFHGGKAEVYRDASNKDRDEQLIKESLKIIEVIINLDSSVRSVFYE